jgi:hypothetical protein
VQVIKKELNLQVFSWKVNTLKATHSDDLLPRSIGFPFTNWFDSFIKHLTAFHHTLTYTEKYCWGKSSSLTRRSMFFVQAPLTFQWSIFLVSFEFLFYPNSNITNFWLLRQNLVDSECRITLNKAILKGWQCAYQPYNRFRWQRCLQIQMLFEETEWII